MQIHLAGESGALPFIALFHWNTFFAGFAIATPAFGAAAPSTSTAFGATTAPAAAVAPTFGAPAAAPTAAVPAAAAATVGLGGQNTLGTTAPFGVPSSSFQVNNLAYSISQGWAKCRFTGLIVMGIPNTLGVVTLYDSKRLKIPFSSTTGTTKSDTLILSERVFHTRKAFW